MLTNSLVDKYYQVLKNKDLNVSVEVPESMKEKDKGNEWFSWRPVVSNITNEEIQKVENRYGINLPKEYIEFIKDKQFLDIQVGDYTLFGVNENNSMEKVFSIFPEDIISSGYIPLGQIIDEDFIALETHTGTVVLLSYDDYRLKKVMFSQFGELIDFLNEEIDTLFT
jgi:hypothetical protein